MFFRCASRSLSLSFEVTSFDGGRVIHDGVSLLVSTPLSFFVFPITKTIYGCFHVSTISFSPILFYALLLLYFFFEYRMHFFASFFGSLDFVYSIDWMYECVSMELFSSIYLSIYLDLWMVQNMIMYTRI